VWRAARLKEAGKPHTVEGAQAKLFASAVARRQTGEAIQILGGYGYTKEFPAERYYRDAKVRARCLVRRCAGNSPSRPARLPGLRRRGHQGLVGGVRAAAHSPAATSEHVVFMVRTAKGWKVWYEWNPQGAVVDL
jgi:hypothetical protein